MELGDYYWEQNVLRDVYYMRIMYKLNKYKRLKRFYQGIIWQ